MLACVGKQLMATAAKSGCEDHTFLEEVEAESIPPKGEFANSYIDLLVLNRTRTFCSVVVFLLTSRRLGRSQLPAYW